MTNAPTILITGAGGFVGRQIVAALAQARHWVINGKEHARGRLIASDVGPVAGEVARSFAGVESLEGDLCAAKTQAAIEQAAPDVIIHLAAVVSGAAEADYDLGIRVNFEATRDLLRMCRAFPTAPVFIFSSSVAVFSCLANDTIDDTALPVPMSSYGAQKLMAETLIRDASRRGHVRGRSIRFPTIAIRPGKPNKATSSFVSSIMREPLDGKQAVLPVARDLRLHLASPDAAVSHVLRAMALVQDELGADTTITLPGISVTVQEMIDALVRVAGPEAEALIGNEPDETVRAIVASWPGEIRAPRAERLGFRPDAGFDALLEAYLRVRG